MNLNDYKKMETSKGNGKYIKFEKTGETRYLRFLYKSGGDTMGEDINFTRKFWDADNKKFVYGTEEGQLVARLKCIEYDEDGSNPRIVYWERSAYFCKNVLLPMWKNFPRIIDGVWKITATSPKTIEATYAVFPIMNADTIKYPIIEEEKEHKDEAVKAEKVEKPEPQPKKKKYWE